MTDENAMPVNLPPLRDTEEIEAEKETEFLPEDEWSNVDIANDWLDFTTPYEQPKYTLSFRGIPFAPLGGIHALTGQAGHGKTMLFTQLMAALLSGKFGELKYQLSDRVPNPTVLYIDTEQERDNTIAVKNRVCKLIGWKTQQARDNFRIIMLRETTTAKDRWRKTLKAIDEMKPTVVFIDGLLDVVEDFNSNEECQRLIYKCMQIASHYNASVWCLVHLNPNGLKLVGHLGSILERKVTDIFATQKDNSRGEAVFTVTQKKARGRDVPEWKFRVLPVDGYGRPEQIDESPEFDNIDKIQQWLYDNRKSIEWPATAKQIKSIFKKNGVGSSDRQQRDLIAAQNRRFIVEQPREQWKKGQKYPKYNLNL